MAAGSAHKVPSRRSPTVDDPETLMSAPHFPTGRRAALTLLAIAGLALLAVQAQAQSTWPSKPITVVVPFPAGGGTDAFARPLSAQLTKQLGQQVIIDNKGGAGGNLGASVAAILRGLTTMT